MMITLPPIGASSTVPNALFSFRQREAMRQFFESLVWRDAVRRTQESVDQAFDMLRAELARMASSPGDQP